MPEMIRYLTKKFSTHSLTEVKPAEQFSLQVRASVLSLDHLEEQVCVWTSSTVITWELVAQYCEAVV